MGVTLLPFASAASTLSLFEIENLMGSAKRKINGIIIDPVHNSIKVGSPFQFSGEDVMCR